MSKHSTVRVKIQGVELSFKTDNPQYIKELAGFVDEQIELVTTSDNVIAPTKAATLAAFNIANELLRLRKEKSEMTEEISRRLDAMLQSADEAYRSTEAPGGG
jgi:cell division protein ZapA